MRQEQHRTTLRAHGAVFRRRYDAPTLRAFGTIAGLTNGGSRNNGEATVATCCTNAPMSGCCDLVIITKP